MIAADGGNSSPLLDCSDCYFQLNYSPGSESEWNARGSGSEAGQGLFSIEGMFALDRAIRSEDARGYDRRLCIFKTCRRNARQCRFEVSVDVPPVEDTDCGDPLYARPWLESRADRPTSSTGSCRRAIRDGEFFPVVEAARDVESRDRDSEEALSRPLSEYNLNLTVNARPKRYSMNRADR